MYMYTTDLVHYLFFHPPPPLLPPHFVVHPHEAVHPDGLPFERAVCRNVGLMQPAE